MYVCLLHTIFRKTNVSYLLMHKSTCVYQELRNVTFPESFVHVLNGYQISVFFWSWIKKYYFRISRLDKILDRENFIMKYIF